MSPLQLPQDSRVYVKEIPGCGRGTFASTHLDAGCQILQIPQPLVLILDVANISRYCDYCYRSPYDQTTFAGQDTILKLVRCKACKTVRYCGQLCQRKAWDEYHKHECRVYASQPSVLPTTNRALLRLLRRHESHLLTKESWDSFEAMEHHYSQVRAIGGQTWNDFCLIAQKLRSDSATDLSLDKLVLFVCRVACNSFTMITPLLEPIGLALDPQAALLNHSCDPNAFVRFDIAPPSAALTPSSYGALTIISLRPVAPHEQVTIAYIDPTNPTPQRQRELKARYHFQCRCPFCLRERGAFHGRECPTSAMAELDHTTQDSITQLRESAQQCLRQVQVGDEGKHVDSLRASMSDLARSNSFQIHHYPWPQLRKQMLVGLLQIESFENAFIQCSILVRKVHPLLYRDEVHPVRLVELWTLSQIGLHLMDINRNVLYVIFAAMQLLQTLLSRGERATGQFEVMVDMMINKLKLQQHLWRNFIKDPGRPWLWLDRLIEANLGKEAAREEGSTLLSDSLS
ncbi:hypothetical protein PV10_01936 [Exophiala mesophila]|uniref:Uncharacterized protein n=1 Tax=Exophiala mesophila TaxID=212818 RepID=A0A0D1ZW62_EXOME|nr:uncharacterized protein PV10_01936 [Exophiala mesophila]KIV98269.1 hypothetical protein PV10_01936 [Exophiala mesophila]